MKISVVGATGMLGKRVVEEAERRGHSVESLTFRLNEEFSSADIPRGDVMINCAGIIPLKDTNAERMIEVNALAPWSLAKVTQYRGIHFIHMSTDCVFSGRHDGLHSDILPDPIDLYGRSKLLGEPTGDHVTVVRGSFIGPDHGFVRWLLDTPENEPIRLYLKAIWNGGSVWAMARALVNIAESGPLGVVHVAADKEISKSRMATYFIEELKLTFNNVKLVKTPDIWRKLEPDILLPPVEDSLDELLKEIKDDY